MKTPAVKAEAAVKGKATRVARGTKGKNQKKTIHGIVPAADAPREEVARAVTRDRWARMRRKLSAKMRSRPTADTGIRSTQPRIPSP